MTTKAVIAFLDFKDDDDIKDVIRQDFIEINDLCERNMGLLVEEVNKRQILMNERESQEELSQAVRRLLEGREEKSPLWEEGRRECLNEGEVSPEETIARHLLKDFHKDQSEKEKFGRLALR